MPSEAAKRRIGTTCWSTYGTWVAEVRNLARAAARPIADAIVPARRARRRQWRRIVGHLTGEVMSGPFAGMKLLRRSHTGSDVPKWLGSYELELHPVVEQWAGYATILDVGCGEGYYVVGLARLNPATEVHGFDVSERAQAQCREMASLNGVDVGVHGLATPELLSTMVSGRTLLIVDAEGAEVDVLDPQRGPRLRDVDVLVELHDFIRPGATASILARFPSHRATFIDQLERRPTDWPLLADLNAEDQHRALDESRASEQRWLWLEADRRGAV